jgi:hypothetical protein
MEKRYYDKLVSVNWLALKSPTAAFLLNTAIILIIMSQIILNQEVKGSSSGLQVFVHVTAGNGRASVCVYSERENLGCRTFNGPDTIPFIFDTESVRPGEKFKACVQAIKLYCANSSYDPLRKGANHIYLSVPELSRSTNQEKKSDPITGSVTPPKNYSQEFLLYTDPDHEFKIWYPSGWSITERNITRSGVVISSPDNAGKILVSSINLSPIESKMSLSELAKSVLLSQTDSRSRLVELDANNYFLSGLPALKVVQIKNADVGLGGGNSAEFKSMSLITLLEGKAYFVSYIAQPEIYPNFLQTVQTIIDSFEITNK